MNPILLALDVEPQEAQGLIAELKPTIEIFKIGSRLFTARGPETVDWAHRAGRKVFLDLKFHDIPQTVAESCRNAARMKAWGFTIHASGGFAMMNEAARSTAEEASRLGIERPLIFGVTVLTSLSDPELQEVGVQRTALQQVEALARLAQKAGLDGVVCSGHEIETVRRACGKDFKLVVPGIRPAQSGKGDQKRVMTPRQAIDLGANYLVIGRPILEQSDRNRAARGILEELR